MQGQLRMVNLGAYLVMVTVNVLAVRLPLNGVAPEEVSDMFPTLFTPAGYVFSIWGLIYLLLAGFVIYPFLVGETEGVRRTGYLFGLSCALNAAWLFAWHWLQLWLSLGIMLALLITLMTIYLRLGRRSDRPSPAGRWVVNLPFSIYLGWISVATIANASATLIHAGPEGWQLDSLIWTIIMLAIATALGAASVQLRDDYGFALVIVWALSGVGAANSDLLIIAAAAWGGGLLLALLIGGRLTARRMASAD